MLKINIDHHMDNNTRFYFTGDIKPFSRHCLDICQSAFFQVASSVYPELDEEEKPYMY